MTQMLSPFVMTSGKVPTAPRRTPKLWLRRDPNPKGRVRRIRVRLRRGPQRAKEPKDLMTPNRIQGNKPQILKLNHRTHLILHFVSFSKGESALGQTVHSLTPLVVVLLQLELQQQSLLLRQRQRQQQLW